MPESNSGSTEHNKQIAESGKAAKTGVRRGPHGQTPEGQGFSSSGRPAGGQRPSQAPGPSGGSGGSASDGSGGSSGGASDSGGGD